MPFTVRDANAVNVVIHHLVGDATFAGQPYSRQDAIDALVLLATGAYKALGTGYAPHESGRFSAREALTTRWPDAPSQVWMLEMHGGEAEPYISEQAARHQVVIDGGWSADADLSWRTATRPLSAGDAGLKILYADGQRTLCYLWPATVHQDASGADTTDPAPDQDVARCQVCGCTEDEPCEGGCAWVTDGSLEIDLCTACAWAIARDAIASGLYQLQPTDGDTLFEARGGLIPQPMLTEAEIDALQPLIAEVEAARGDLAKLDEIEQRERQRAIAAANEDLEQLMAHAAIPVYVVEVDGDPVIHAEELDENGHPTGHARCDRGDGAVAGSRLAVNAGRVTCAACIAWPDDPQAES